MVDVLRHIRPLYLSFEELSILLWWKHGRVVIDGLPDDAQIVNVEAQYEGGNLAVYVFSETFPLLAPSQVGERLDLKIHAFADPTNGD